MKVRNYEMPDDLHYHDSHTWVRVEGDKVRVGLNDFAQAAAGDITYIDLPFEGDEVEAGETCGKIQSSKWVGKLIAPVSGEIIEVNSDLENDARLVNRSCYGDGWFIVIQAASLEDELGALMKGQAAADWLESEIQKVEKEKHGE
jgi:glycine cleavage system H protein